MVMTRLQVPKLDMLPFTAREAGRPDPKHYGGL